MKVLLLTPSFPPELNSTARVFSELGEDLAQLRHDVTVLTRAPERYVVPGSAPLPRGVIYRESANGMQVVRRKNIPVPRHIPLVRILEQVWMALSFLLIGLTLGRFHAVIVYSPPLPLGLTGFGLARRGGGRLILNVQDLYPQTGIDLELLRGRFVIGAAQQLERFLYRHADAITVHSEGNRAYVIRQGTQPERVHVVPNWVDLKAVKPGPRMNGWRQAHGYGDAFVVSFAGTMGFAQGLEDVIEAADRLRDVPELMFVLAGDGVSRAHLEAAVRTRRLTNVRFVPPQSADAYLALLHSSDLCLVTLNPKLTTPVVPGKLPTIMAAGRAVICMVGPRSDARHVVEASGCGRFIPAGAPERLAEMVLDLSRNRDLVEEMGRRARAYAEVHFDRTVCTRQYHDLVTSLGPRSLV